MSALLWRSVREELPATDEDGLVFQPQGDPVITVGSYDGDDEAGPWAVIVERDGFMAPARAEITHWAPLSTPGQEDPPINRPGVAP